MKIVPVYNFKGGAGKTTVTHHLATGLAMMGKKVLVLDTDPQGHSSMLLGAKPSPKLYNYLVRSEEEEGKFNAVAQGIPHSRFVPEGETCKGEIVLIAGNDETSYIPMQLKDPRVMRRQLNKVSSIFDICLIDTPPTPTLMSLVVYIAADAVFYPTMCENLHIDGLKRALEARHDADSYRSTLGLSSLDIVGIQPMIFRKNVREHEEYLSWLKENYDNVWQPIGQSVVWAEATRDRKPVFSYAKDTQAAQESIALVQRFAREVAQ